MVYRGLIDPEDILDSEKPGSEWSSGDVTIGYGVANWHKLNSEAEEAQRIFNKILESPWWSSWAYVVTENEQHDR